jgi:hypothetical protein
MLDQQYGFIAHAAGLELTIWYAGDNANIAGIPK